MLEDTLLKLRFNKGDKDDLLRLAVALLHDTGQAEDAVNEAFVVFAESVGRLSVRGNLKSFLTTCIVNRARSMHRSRQRRNTVGLDAAGQMPSNSKGPEESVVIKEEFHRLQNAMADLPYQQQEIIVLRLQNDMRFSRIAQLLGVSANTVKSRYRYGMDKLHSLLDCEVIR